MSNIVSLYGIMIAVQFLVEAAVLFQQPVNTLSGSLIPRSPHALHVLCHFYPAVRMEAWIKLTEHKQLFARFKACSQYLNESLSSPKKRGNKAVKVSSWPTYQHSRRSRLCFAGTGVVVPSYGNPFVGCCISAVDDTDSNTKELFISYPGCLLKN